MMSALLALLAVIVGAFILRARQMSPDSGLSQSVVAEWAEYIAFAYAAALFFLWIPFRRNQELERELTALKSSPLTIEAIECDMTLGQVYTCRIRVHNKGERSVGGIRVELCDIGHLQFHQLAKPIFLLSNDPNKSRVNPGAFVDWDFLGASASESEPCRGDFTVNAGVVGRQGACFVLVYQPDTDYSVRFKVTAEDTPALEKEFRLKFSVRPSSYRFTLTPT